MKLDNKRIRYEIVALLTALIIMLLSASIWTIVTWWMEQYRAIREIRELGGDVVVRVSDEDVLVNVANEDCSLWHPARSVYLGTRLPPSQGHSRHKVYIRDILARDAALNDRHIAAICTLTSLDTLDLGALHVTDVQLAQLRSLKHLKVLILDCTDVTDESLPALLSFRKLKYLNVKGTRITPQGVRELLANNPELQVVD